MATQAAKNAASSTESVTLLLYIALSFAVPLMVNVWLFYRVSGGLFNPALTLAFVLLRVMSPAKGALLAVSQLLAGIVAAGVAKALVPGYDLQVQTGLGKGVTSAQGVFIEAVLTAELALAVFMVLHSFISDHSAS
jgi:aquaporin related protein